jgi:CHAD domain-containing protein
MSSESTDKPLSAKEQQALALAAARSYSLHQGEEPGEGIRRVARGRLDGAVEHLRRDADEDLAKAVHDTRKDMKKLRSVLRLVRDELGPKRYRAENGRYRDAAQLLSGARDAEVKLATLDALRERYPDEAPEAEALEGRLEDERDRLAGDADDPEVSERLEEAAEAIDQGAAEVDAWEFSKEGFDLLRPGLERSYARGRDALRSVRDDPSAESVHDWRKRVKDLWYHLRLLREIWPAELKGAADEAHKLSDLLGDHHDLSVLIDEIHAESPEDSDLQTLAELAERRQGELLDEALPSGDRLYAEKPRQFTKRLGAYWKAAHPGHAA